MATSKVDSINTRRVEWVVPGVVEQVQQLPSDKDRLGIVSPPFEAAGCQGLRLELVLFKERSSFSESGEVGDCEVHLWATDGLSLVFKLFVGAHSVQREHSFDSRSPCSSGRLCSLSDEACPSTGELRVGVDILEAVREVFHPQISADGGDEPPRHASEGSLVSSRHLNHRVVDLVRGQVDLMHSRMVRRIEWRIEHASSLRSCFGEGEPLCSPTFVAAGVEGLQLVFFPSGQGAKEGFCSLFLHCPAGSMLKCRLWAGSQHREARVFNERSGVFGRTNFGRFESVTAAGDIVPIALDIEEASQDVKESLSHRVATDGKCVASTMRLQRTPGKASLEDVRQLPSIWTPRPQVDVPALDGFRSFSDLKKRSCSKRRHLASREMSPPDKFLMYAP